MKFGKRLKKQVEESLPEWRDKFLAYKRLKRLVRLVSAAGSSSPRRRRRGSAAEEAAFVRLLDAEVDRFNAFFLEREEDFVIRHRARRPPSACPPIPSPSIPYAWCQYRCECDVRLRVLIVACAAQELMETAKKVAEDAWRRRRPPSAAETTSVRKEIVDLHGEMVLLLNYSAINYTGLL